MNDGSEPSVKPYMLRAWYEWCCDSGYTPYIAVWVDEFVNVPRQYVKNNEIVLNVGDTACVNLSIDNQWVTFTARFAGVAHHISIPVGNVLSIFARETGRGMGFELESTACDLHPAETTSENITEIAPVTHSAGLSDDHPDKPDPGSHRPNLRIIK